MEYPAVRNRIQPILPPEAMKTYQIVAPISTHFVPATCEQIGCPHYLNGWKVRAEALSPEDLHLARTSGRRFTELAVTEGETWLIFEAGQPCFAADTHQARLDRPEIFLVREGDFRGNPRGAPPRRHVNAADFVEDFALHQDKLATRLERG